MCVYEIQCRPKIICFSSFCFFESLWEVIFRQIYFDRFSFNEIQFFSFSRSLSLPMSCLVFFLLFSLSLPLTPSSLSASFSHSISFSDMYFRDSVKEYSVTSKCYQWHVFLLLKVLRTKTAMYVWSGFMVKFYSHKQLWTISEWARARAFLNAQSLIA